MFVPDDQLEINNIVLFALMQLVVLLLECVCKECLFQSPFIVCGLPCCSSAMLRVSVILLSLPCVIQVQHSVLLNDRRGGKIAKHLQKGRPWKVE